MITGVILIKNEKESGNNDNETKNEISENLWLDLQLRKRNKDIQASAKFMKSLNVTLWNLLFS
jgi:hypothetical protein